MTPVSIRTNNPGAQWFGPIARQYGATGTENLSDGNNAAVFPDPVHGAAAQFALWGKKYSGMPLSAAIQKWSGNNSSPAYANFISKMTGLSGDTPLTPDVLSGPSGLALAKAQARWETGRDYPMSDDQWKQAQALAFNGAQPSGDLGSAPSQSAITQAMSGGGDNASIPANAKPVMFSPGQNDNSGGLLSQLQNKLKQGPGPIGNGLSSLGAGLIAAVNPGAGAQMLNAQAARRLSMLPNLQQTGQDILGRPQYSWVDKLRQTVTPMGANGSAGGAGGATGSTGSTGDGGVDANLAQITQLAQGGKTDKQSLINMADPAVRGDLDAMLNYKAVPTNLSSRGPMRNALITYAHAIDPTFDETKLPQKVDFMKKLAGQSMTTIGGQKQVLGTAFEHLADVSDQLVKLHNVNGGVLGDLPGGAAVVHGLNAVGNSGVDKSGITNALNSGVEKFSGEVGKLYSGNQGGGVHEREATRNHYSPNLAPTEAGKALEMDLGLMTGKLNQMRQQRDDILGSNSGVKFLNPTQQAALDRIQKNISALNGGGTAPAAQSAPSDMPTVNSPDEAAKLPKGTRFRDPQGTIRIVQ